MKNLHYQRRFSETYPQAVYNREARQKKAKTIVAVLSDFFHTGYMIRPDTNRARLAKFMAHYVYWLCPGYISLLQKSIR